MRHQQQLPGGRFHHFTSRIALLGLAAVIFLSAQVVSAAAPPTPSKHTFRSMTVNLYVGAGVEDILALDPTDPGYVTNLVATVTRIYYGILASDPATRMAGVADQILAQAPDVVALQEASLLRVQSPGDLIVGGTNQATQVVADYLQLLLDALEARGGHYAVASQIEELDTELPMMNLATGTIDDARLTDRDVILVRTDLPPGFLWYRNAQSGHFTYHIENPVTGLTVPRGWCSIDVFSRGNNVRFICSHLEIEVFPQLQAAQAMELVAGPANTGLPVVLLGDFNADPLHRDGSYAYDVLVGAGFQDAWTATHPEDPAGGLTWGHDEFLADSTVPFVTRIDLILYRGRDLYATDVEPIDMVLGRTQPPFWASDHACVSAGFQMHPAAPKQ